MRHGVVGFAVALSMITYIDRVALSNARKQVATSLHLSDAEMGLVFTAFAVAYALFEIPSGFMGDRLGPRRVLLRITIWWSIFTAITGRAWN
ncbi:MAG TPA: MFS transporter, partial [Bryobacteraceae bacterium]|nr:MFS transporter [Bryobacteraceae bacterium]